MTKKIVTVLLIEDSPEYAELVRRWLSPQDDMEFVVHRADSLRAGLSRFKMGRIDAILLDLGLPDSQGMETFSTAKMHAGGIPILVLSGSDTESAALQTIQQGTEDYYIMKSTCDDVLLVKAMRHAVGRATQCAGGNSVADLGAVIGVMGSKGGVGVTTFACNLALELRRRTGQRALLADLDVNAGLVSFLMRTTAEHTIPDVLANVHHPDHSYWSDIVTDGPEGVDIMPSPNLLGVDAADIGKIQEVLGTIRMFYRWTVLDLGRVASLSLSFLDKVRALYLVTTVNVPALHEAKRTIGVLLRAGLHPERLRLIVNQVDPARTTDDLDGLFGIPVHARLPCAGQELDDACSRGQVLNANSDYRVQVEEVARGIADLPEEASGGTMAHLRSFAGNSWNDHRDVALATRR